MRSYSRSLQLGSALVEHVRAHRDHSLAEHEDGVLAAWRAVAPALLEGVLQTGHDGTGDERASDRGAVSRLSAAAWRAVAAQARRADAAGSDRTEALVASLLAMWAWLEPARPGAGAGALSADECRSGTLGGGTGRGHHLS